MTRVVALLGDLMDRSRLAGAVPGLEAITDPADAVGAEVVVVDLARHADDVRAVRRLAPRARIVAFGAHVDGPVLAAARSEGADVVLPRSRFFRDPAGALDVTGSADPRSEPP